MTIKEIAKIAGVSPSTVSKIMNQKDDDIRPETRERVLKIVKDYNYTPYASIITPPQITWILGILYSSKEFDSTLEGIIHTAQENGYTTIVCCSYSDSTQELKNIAALCKHHVDGIIWEPACKDSLTFASHFEESGIPFITTGSYGGESSLLFPYSKFGKALTQELLDLKHTKIACLLDRSSDASAFLSGYKECLFENHQILDEELVFYELNDSLIYHINSHQISGIISLRYQKSLELYQLIRSLHYRIPEDISLISLKDNSADTLSYPKLSTCTISKSAFGVYLCRKLVDKIKKSEPPKAHFDQTITLDNDSSVNTPYSLTSSKIVVVGSINIDTYLYVEKLPNTGKTVSTSKSSIYPGGKAVNQSIGVSKLGHRVSLIGNVGSDLDSDIIYRTLNEYDIDTYGVKRCNQMNTGKAYIIVENNGDSMISILAGANAHFTPEDIRKKCHLFEDAGYCLIQSEIPLDTVEEACRIAHQYNTKTIFKPSACSALSESILQNIDILVPNQKELAELCPDTTWSIEEQVSYLLNCGIETVIVTLGAQGCYVKNKELEQYFPAADFTAVDNTGASDAFICTFASYLLYGYSLEKAVKIATYAAGFCISRDGVVPALIERNSLESYINQVEPKLLNLST